MRIGDALQYITTAQIHASAVEDMKVSRDSEQLPKERPERAHAACECCNGVCAGHAHVPQGHGRQQPTPNGSQTASRRPTREQAAQGDSAAGSAQPSGGGITHAASMQDMGASVMNAVQNIAEMTDFQAKTAPHAGGGVGDVMLERFRQFDEHYLQPTFGRHERIPSEEMANVAVVMEPESRQGTSPGQGPAPYPRGEESDDGK